MGKYLPSMDTLVLRSYTTRRDAAHMGIIDAALEGGRSIAVDATENGFACHGSYGKRWWNLDTEACRYLHRKGSDSSGPSPAGEGIQVATVALGVC